jgi:hypothetical protein
VNVSGKLLAAAVTAGIGVLIALLSQWPVERASGDSIIRLSWRTEPLRAEECRTLTEEELAAVPAHMRRAQECVGEYVDYELSVTVDGVSRVDTLSPSGLRHDRPVYVLRDVPSTSPSRRSSRSGTMGTPSSPASVGAAPYRSPGATSASSP